MRSTFVALALLALAAPGRAQDAKVYDLRGPAPVAGAKLEVASTFTMKDADAVIKVAGQTVEFKQTIASTETHQLTVVAVDGRKVTKSKKKVVKDSTESSVTIGGQDKADTKAGDFEGETILSERDGEKWKNSLVDTAPSAKQKKKLAKMHGPEGDDEMYPAEKVKVGHAWKTDASALTKNFGESLTDLKGSLNSKFLRVEMVDGEECAVVESKGTITGESDGGDDEDEGEDAKDAPKLAVEMELNTLTYRSLKTGLDVKSSFTGKMKMSGKRSIQGMDAEISIEGPISGEETEAVAK